MARLLLGFKLGKVYRKGMNECKAIDKCLQRHSLQESMLNDLVQQIYWFCISYMRISFCKKTSARDCPPQMSSVHSAFGSEAAGRCSWCCSYMYSRILCNQVVPLLWRLASSSSICYWFHELKGLAKQQGRSRERRGQAEGQRNLERCRVVATKLREVEQYK